MTHKKDFDKWNEIKKKIENFNPKLFEERQIWWTSLGINIGFEQNGKNNDFSRPVLVIKKYNKNMAVILPITSKNKEGNNFYYPIKYHGRTFYIILSQIKLISSKRLIRRIWKIPPKEFKKIKNILKNNFL